MSLVSAVRRFVEAWTLLYTLGLAPAHRRDRIDLIRADIHDEVTESRASGTPEHVLAASLLSRCLRGAPADITWRLFEAHRLPGRGVTVNLEGRTIMPAPTSNGTSPAFLALAAAVAAAAALTLAVQPVAHSLSYTGGLLAGIALVAWALEARAAGDDEAAPSAWPLLLSIGIVATAGGVVFDSGRLGLVLAVPVASGLTIAFARGLILRHGATAMAGRAYIAGPTEAGPTDVALHAARGDVIAIERGNERGVTRRALLRGGFGLGLASVLAAMGGIVVDFLWQRNVAGFGGVVNAGPLEKYPPGSKTIVREGKFWLVNLTAEQGGPGYLALWQKCPHLGCVVPWNERFGFVDPDSGQRTEGWFRCPCHQSTYNHAGVRVYGPAPRSMDRMALTITEDGYIQVDTGDITRGAEDNATFAVEGSSS